MKFAYPKKLQFFFSKEYVIYAIYCLAATLIAIQHYLHDTYNNFKIFRASTAHLLAGNNLHVEYPAEYFDLFLYHPTFAVLFSPFSFIPTWLGIILWNIFTASMLFWAIKALPLPSRSKIFVWYFVFIELTTALHNLQTNPLIAALILLAFSLMEFNHRFRAAIVAALAFFIKGYGGIVAIMYLFYPKEIIKNSFIYLFSFIILAILPGFFVGFAELPRLYEDWKVLLLQDHQVNYGVSLIGMFHSLFGDVFSVFQIQLAGLFCLVTMCVYFLLTKIYSNSMMRVAMLAYLMIWVILFNHAAESNTHIISVCGVALWYILSPKDLLSKILLAFVFFLTCLSPTDIFPKIIRETYIIPYNLKAFPIFLVWIHLQCLILKKNIQIPNV